jgi:arsenite methyltransferase
VNTLLRFDGARATEADLEAHTPEMLGQRKHLRDRLALSPGEKVLDVGCGPGYLAEEMARDVGPDGEVCGIDISESMLALARDRCSASSQVSLRAGRCEEIPYGDGVFDAAVSVQVYEYVQDIERALAELFRVLRPGGRAVIFDTDWDSLVWHTADRRRMRRVLELWDDHVADPRLPERLGVLLRDAGFREESVTTLTFLNRDCNERTYSYWLIGFIEAFLTGHPDADRAEKDAWSEELRARARAGRYFFSLGRYAFTVIRPAG